MGSPSYSIAVHAVMDHGAREACFCEVFGLDDQPIGDNSYTGIVRGGDVSGARQSCSPGAARAGCARRCLTAGNSRMGGQVDSPATSQ